MPNCFVPFFSVLFTKLVALFVRLFVCLFVDLFKIYYYYFLTLGLAFTAARSDIRYIVIDFNGDFQVIVTGSGKYECVRLSTPKWLSHMLSPHVRLLLTFRF